MSLNFPSTPADQQVYENYIYDTAKGVWNKLPVSGGGTADDNAIFKATLFFGGK
jgi:hypothetical protein